MNDVADLTERLIARQQSARANAALAAEDDPEKAARALDLSEATGVPPTIIYPDLENFDRRAKAQFAGDIVRNNPVLADYVNSNPMAAKISNDDFGKLDLISSKLQGIFRPTTIMRATPILGGLIAARDVGRVVAGGGPGAVERGFVSTLIEQNPDLVAEFLEGASLQAPEGVRGGALIGALALRDLAKLRPAEYRRKVDSMWDIGDVGEAFTWLGETVGQSLGSAAMPLAFGGAGAAVGSVGGPGGAVVGGVVGAGSTSYVMSFGEIYKALKQEGVPRELAAKYAAAGAVPMAALDVASLGTIVSRFGASGTRRVVAQSLAKRIAQEIAVGATTEGVTESLQEMIKDATVSLASGKPFISEEHAKGWLESAVSGAIGGAALTGPAALRGPSPQDKVKPWIDAGKEPPPGVDRQIDEVIAEQSKMDGKWLEDVTAAAQTSATRERSPRFFSELVRQQVGDARIGISSEIIAQLYAGKMPKVDDNILGWVPDLERQMYTALPTGGDIEIPLSLWLARVDKGVAKELRDFTRVRANGVTKVEAEVRGQVVEMIDAWHGSPHTFEAFDLGKIGTGEGGQAYGHGLYFGENRAVGEQYKALLGGQVSSSAEQLANQALLYDSDRSIAAKKLRERAKREQSDPFSGIDPAEMEAAAKLIDAGWTPPEGNLYKVRIHADKEQFLDYDKPLTAQSEAIQAAARQAATRAALKGREPQPGVLADIPAEQQTSGRALYSLMTAWAEGDAKASELLAKAGIPGLRYLDQQSRSDLARLQDQLKVAVSAEKKAEIQAQIDAFQGTYNYVIFDPSIVEIVARNDQAVASTRASSGVPIDYGTGPRPGWVWAPREERSIIARTGTYNFVPLATTSLRSALSSVKLAEIDVPLRKQMQPILDRVLEVAGDVDVHLVSRELFNKMRGKSSKTAAFYSWESQDRIRDHIILPTDIFYDQKAMQRILLHESLHAATSRAISVNPALQADLKAVLDEIKTQFPDWGNKYGLTDIHELITEAFSNKDFQVGLSSALLSESLGQKLGIKDWRGKSIFWGILDWIRRAVGISSPESTLAIEAVLKLTEQAMAEVEAMPRPKAKTVQEAQGKTTEAREEQPELPGITRQEDLRIFQTITGFMNKAMYDRYMELIAKRSQEDSEYQLKKIEKQLRKEMSDAWKAEEVAMLPTVREEIRQRIDISVLEFFRSGNLYGEDLGHRPRINPQHLTPEQLKIFPEKYLRRDGMHPQDVANLFGFPTIDEMLAAVSEIEGAAGKGSTDALVEKLARFEVKRRMKAKHGELDENILQEAMDHVISDTQLDLLIEDVVALGMAQGSEMTFDKADWKAWVQARFLASPANLVSLEKYLRESGRAGIAIEKGLLVDDDPKAAFHAKQRQILAHMLAAEAKKFERVQERFDKNVERMSKRVVKGLDQEFTNWIQLLLAQVGRPGKRSVRELQEAIAKSEFGSFMQLVGRHISSGGEIFVATEVLEGRPKPIEQMTVQEFLDFEATINSLIKVARETKQITIAGDKRDFEAWKKEVLERIRSLPRRNLDKERAAYKFDAWITNIEEIIQDLDLREELGPLFQAIIPTLADAQHTEYTMMENLVKELRAIHKGFGRQWQKSLDDPIPNDFFLDPGQDNEVPYAMTRSDMIGIMLNWGNRSNIEKFTEGYAGRENGKQFESRLQTWFDLHANREDWEFVQKIWDIFEGWRQEADDLYHRLAGVPPKWIEPQSVTTPFGVFKGGFYPIIYDRRRSNIAVKQERQPEQGQFGPDYIRATTPAGHFKERTGYRDYVEFRRSVDLVGLRMQQIIHDISFREAVMQVGKIVYDEQIRAAINQHYGVEYADKLHNWLKNVANQYTMHEAEASFGTELMRTLRANYVSHALGLSIRIMLSPSVAKANPADIARYGGFWSYKHQANQEMILEKSRELRHTFQNMDRDFREAMEAAARRNKWDTYRAKAMRAGFWPIVMIEKYFREVTFFNEYQDAIKRGLDEGDAISAADSAVRTRHGSGAVWHLPPVMRGGEWSKAFTMFYGWFNMTYNWHRQIPGMYRRGEYMDIVSTAWATVLLPMVFSAVLFTERKEKESFFWTLAKSLPLQYAGMFPFLREAASFAIEGYPSRTVISALINAGYSVFNDIRKMWEDKKTKNEIRHIANLAGILTGVPAGQVGRTGQFIFDVRTGRQRPKDFFEWTRGLIYGEAKLKKERK